MKINLKLKEDLKSFLMEKIQKEHNRVLVLSADKLGDNEKKVLEKKFTGLDWSQAVFQIDRTVIAGIIIKVGSKTIDLSLTGSLTKLTNTLYEID